MSVSIRRAAPNDYLAVESIENAADLLLIDRLSPESWEPAPSGLSRAAQPGFVLVAEEAGTGAIVGFVHVLENHGIAHLEQLSVLPQEGRRGYGRLLLQAAMDEARRRGYERLTLRTYADSPGTRPSMRALALSRRCPQPTSTRPSSRSRSDSGFLGTGDVFR